MMGETTAHGLDGKQVALIRAILAPYKEKIQSIGLFGSRATGNYRPNSDIDLVLYGPVDDRTRDRLWTDFSESSLPFKVDVVAYDLIDHPPLKAHIDAVGVPLEK